MGLRACNSTDVGHRHYTPQMLVWRSCVQRTLENIKYLLYLSCTNTRTELCSAYPFNTRRIFVCTHHHHKNNCAYNWRARMHRSVHFSIPFRALTHIHLMFVKLSISICLQHSRNSIDEYALHGFGLVSFRFVFCSCVTTQQNCKLTIYKWSNGRTGTSSKPLIALCHFKQRLHAICRWWCFMNFPNCQNGINVSKTDFSFFPGVRNLAQPTITSKF